MSINPDSEAAWFEQELRAAGSAERAASSQNYLKSTREFTGTTVPVSRAITIRWRREHPDLTGPQLVAVTLALWQRPVFECQLTAVLLLADRRRLLAASDAADLEQMLRTAGTWALVDSLAADVVGSLVERFPELLPMLDRWVTDENFWIRRSALLALLVPLRRGDSANFERFGRYADAMLTEREFFIRKAIGWVLRETGKRQPELVTDWLAPRLDRVSGVTIREAVKWLPPADRDRLLAGYSATRPERPARSAG